LGCSAPNASRTTSGSCEHQLRDPTLFLIISFAGSQKKGWKFQPKDFKNQIIKKEVCMFSRIPSFLIGFVAALIVGLLGKNVVASLFAYFVVSYLDAILKVVKKKC
jgi:hypothetical protein